MCNLLEKLIKFSLHFKWLWPSFRCGRCILIRIYCSIYSTQDLVHQAHIWSSWWLMLFPGPSRGLAGLALQSLFNTFYRCKKLPSFSGFLKFLKLWFILFNSLLCPIDRFYLLLCSTTTSKCRSWSVTSCLNWISSDLLNSRFLISKLACVSLDACNGTCFNSLAPSYCLSTFPIWYSSLLLLLPRSTLL